MAIVILNKKVLESLIGKKISDIKEKLRDIGVGIEKIDENEIHIEVDPNRPDFLSEQGFGRAFSSFLGIKTGLKKFDIKKSDHNLIVEDSVKHVRPYTACAVVKNLKFNDEKIREVIQIQEKLHITFGRNRKKLAIGIYPFEKIATPIRFIAKKAKDIKFRALEAPKEMSAEDILKLHPAGKDYGHLLENLGHYPLFVDANNNILSMPPIINSHDIGKVNETTREVFIEVSGFDYEACAKCLNILVTTLADMGGDIYSMQLDLYGKKLTSPDLSPEEMKIDNDYVNKILGLNLKEAEIKSLLERMGYSYNKGKVLIPCYRADILHQIDLIEDIAIAYGYENFKEEIPKVATIAQSHPVSLLKRKVGDILAGLGFLECSCYHLSSKEKQSDWMEVKQEYLELANSVNLDYHVLSAWALPSLIDTLKGNKHHEFPQNIFTIGKSFRKGKSETGIEEEERLAVALSYDNADYTRIRQVVDYLLRMLDIQYQLKDDDHPSFISGRSVSIWIDNKKAGILGEVSPKVLENWQLIMPVACFELSISSLR